VNMGPDPVSLPSGRVLCASVALPDAGVLPPDAAVWLTTG